MPRAGHDEGRTGDERADLFAWDTEVDLSGHDEAHVDGVGVVHLGVVALGRLNTVVVAGHLPRGRAHVVRWKAYHAERRATVTGEGAVGWDTTHGARDAGVAL